MTKEQLAAQIAKTLGLQTAWCVSDDNKLDVISPTGIVLFSVNIFELDKDTCYVSGTTSRFMSHKG